MSYLDLTRLNFRGYFQADVSTVNNNVKAYDIESFKPEVYDDSWNPVGTGSFRLIDCAITGGAILGQPVVIPKGVLSIANSDLRVSGKMVDLDPQQQTVSEIWGMTVRLTLGENLTMLKGEYKVAPFINLWRRQQEETPNSGDDQLLAAVYQSVIDGLDWGKLGDLELVTKLKAVCPNQRLSINMNVFGYGRDPKIARYTMGHVVGSIGPWYDGEPSHFVLGRQCIAQLGKRLAATSGIGSFTCKVHLKEQMISADFGNAIPIETADSGLLDKGDLILAVCKNADPGVLKSVAAAQVEIIGTLKASEYCEQQWYAQTAGIVDFPLEHSKWALENIQNYPLLLLGAQENDSYKVLVQESIGGNYVRSDGFVGRLNPGESATFDLYATRFGQALSNAEIAIAAVPDNLAPGNDEPPTCTPPDAISFASSLTTDANGKASLTVTASPNGPGNPRGYIDGQIYAIGYNLAAQPPDYIANAWNFISILAFDKQPFTTPTWYQDIQPIFTQYGNLYPIMSRHLLDLSSYDSVVQHLTILKLAFSLPINNPNHMPVTRDLSKDRLAMIQTWMNTLGNDGLPLKGTPPPPKVASPLLSAAPPLATPVTSDDGLNLGPLQTGGKTAFILKRLAAQQAKAKQGSQS